MDDRVDTLLPSVLGNGQGQELSASQSTPGLAMRVSLEGKSSPLLEASKYPLYPHLHPCFQP